MYSKQDFVIWTLFGLISVFIGCLVETRNYSILSLAFIASSFRVTEENLVFETVQTGPYSFLNISLLLKELTFIFYLHVCNILKICSLLKPSANFFPYMQHLHTVNSNLPCTRFIQKNPGLLPLLKCFLSDTNRNCMWRKMNTRPINGWNIKILIIYWLHYIQIKLEWYRRTEHFKTSCWRRRLISVSLISCLSFLFVIRASTCNALHMSLHPFIVFIFIKVYTESCHCTIPSDSTVISTISWTERCLSTEIACEGSERCRKCGVSLSRNRHWCPHDLYEITCASQKQSS